MNVPMNAKRLRGSLPDVVERVRKGTRFTVVYRSRPAFQIVPVDDAERGDVALTGDSLYRARSEASPQTAEKDRCSVDCVVKVEGFGAVDVRRTFGARPLRGRLMLGPIG